MPVPLRAGGVPGCMWCEQRCLHIVSAFNKKVIVHMDRAALEGERVSQSLHAWIDLTFGHALRGPAALQALNVELPQPEAADLRRRRRPQLFDAPHPRRPPRSCWGEPQRLPVSCLRCFRGQAFLLGRHAMS